MKNYKEYDRVYIGSSDICALTLHGTHRIKGRRLKFGEDGTYRAYLVDGEAQIDGHYKLMYTALNRLAIYDDSGMSAEFYADIIKVYQAGFMGCIVQLIGAYRVQQHKDGATQWLEGAETLEGARKRIKGYRRADARNDLHISYSIWHEGYCIEEHSRP